MIKINISKSIRLNRALAAFVSFNYNNVYVSAIRNLNLRFWHPDKKMWEISLDEVKPFLLEVGTPDFTISGTYDANEITDKKPEKLIDDLIVKTEPYKYQLDGLLHGLSTDKFLLNDDQGLGKTKQIIDIAVNRKYSEGLRHCLIVVCRNGHKWNWRKEIMKHSDEGCVIIGSRSRKNGRLYAGSNQDKLEDLRSNNASKLFLIINIESFRDKEIVAELKAMTAAKIIDMIAVDEIHYCRNPSSAQGKGLLSVSATYQIPMSGTPIVESPLDAYLPLAWMGYEQHSFYQFKKHYCVFGGYGGKQVVGYKNMGELKNRIEKVRIRRLKSQELDLPPKIRHTEYVEMGAAQSNLYNEMLEAIKDDLDLIKMSVNPLSQLIRLRQITGYPGIVSSRITDSAKLDRLEEYANEFIAAGKKIILFSNWTKMLDAVMDRLRIHNCVRIDGTQTEEQNKQAEETFMEDETCKVIMGTIGAMGTAYTLTKGSVIIFLDEPWNAKVKEQAEDRGHRIGTTEPLFIITLITSGTIDERVNDIVIGKGEIADFLVDGKIQTNDRSKTIDYLIS